MPETYKQVLISYLTRAVFWLPMLPLSFAVLLGQLPSDSRRGDMWLGQSLMWLCWGAFAAGCMVGWQLKRQFAHPRARLLADFAKPHMIVATAVSLLYIVPMSVWFAASRDLSPWGLIAVSTLMFAAGAWAFAEIYYWYSTWHFVVWQTPMWLAMLRVEVRPILADTPVMLAILICSAALLALLGARLMGMTEDDKAYHLAMLGWGRWSKKAKRQTGPQAVTGTNVRFSEKLLGRSCDLPDSLRSRGIGMETPTRLLRMGQSNISPAKMGLMMGGFWVLFYFYVSPRGTGWEQHPSGQHWSITFAIGFLAVMGSMQTAMALIQRGKWMGMESLRPVSRKGFAHGMVNAAISDILQFWGAGMIGVVSLIILWGSADILHIMSWVLFSACTLTLSLGVTLWLASYRSMILLGIAVFLGTQAAMVLPMIFRTWLPEAFLAPRNVIGLQLGAIVVGGIFLALAYRSWCRVEMGRL